MFRVDASLHNKAQAVARECGSNTLGFACTVCPESGVQISPSETYTAKDGQLVLVFRFAQEPFVTVTLGPNGLVLEEHRLKPYACDRMQIESRILLPNAQVEMLDHLHPPQVITKYRLAVEACLRRLRSDGKRACYGNVPGMGRRSRQASSQRR